MSKNKTPIHWIDIENTIDEVLHHLNYKKGVNLNRSTLRKIKRLIQYKNSLIKLLNEKQDIGFMTALNLIRIDLDNSSTATEFYNKIRRRLNYEDTKEDTNS